MSEQTAVPRHVGIIMDGNRRWAREQGLKVTAGHEAGVETLKKIAKQALNSGVQYITFFAFSTENWKRSKIEVTFLMDLVARLIKNELDEFIRDGHKIAVLGSRQRLSKKISQLIDEAEEKTKDGTAGTIAFCFNYSSDQEMSDALAACEKDIKQNGASKQWRDYLYHPEIPDVDLIIRTSGEQRLSGFMLPRASYAELIFTDVYWPAYGVDDFSAHLAEFSDRKRRYGE